MYICSFLSNRTNVPTRLLIITPTTNVYFRFYLGNHFLEYCTLLYLLLCNACRKMKIDIFDMDVEYGNSVIMNLCQVFIFSTERKLPNVPFFFKFTQWITNESSEAFIQHYFLQIEIPNLNARKNGTRSSSAIFGGLFRLILVFFFVLIQNPR